MYCTEVIFLIGILIERLFSSLFPSLHILSSSVSGAAPLPAPRVRVYFTHSVCVSAPLFEHL